MSANTWSLNGLGGFVVYAGEISGLREGMEVLVGYLASVRDGWEDGDEPIH